MPQLAHVCCTITTTQCYTYEFFRLALLSPELEKGSSLNHLHTKTCPSPSDILIASWSIVTAGDDSQPKHGVSTNVGFTRFKREVTTQRMVPSASSKLRWACGGVTLKCNSERLAVSIVLYLVVRSKIRKLTPRRYGK